MNVDQTIEASFSAAESAKTASKELVRTAHKYRETAQASCENAFSLAKQLKEMYSSDWIKESPHIDVAKYLRYLTTTFNAVNSVQQQMVNSLEKKFVQPLENFTNYDFLEMHEARKKLIGTAADYDAMRQKIEVSLTGNTKKRIGKKKETYDPVQLSQDQTELDRLSNEHTETQKHLKNVLEQTHQKKETKLLKHMLELLELQYEYHEKAYNLLNYLKPKMVELRAQLDQSVKDETQVKEGHLMQKASNNSWQKFWYVLKDGHLSCYKGKKDAASLVESLNVMYCSPKIPIGSSEKAAQFQVATPSKKKPILLQAETPEERDSWMKAIQQAIEVQLNQNEPAVRVTQSDSLAFKILSSIEGNGFCADCSAPAPDWASINLGILVCLSCSGVHRNLGTHISKVRSTTLDTKAWEPQLLLFMKQIGNKKFNELFEKVIPTDVQRPDYTKNPDDERPVREKFIKAKYADKSFLPRSGLDKDTLASELFELIQREDDQTLEIFRLIMDGANLEWKNPEDEDKTVVHCAVIFDKLCYLEMIIQNGGSIFCLETRNWTPMHYAAYYHRVHCAAVLHKHGFGAKQLEYKDWQNKTAIELALNGGCDEIVDILRNTKEMCGVGFSVEDLYDGSDSEDDDASEDPLSSSSGGMASSAHSLVASNSGPIPASVVAEDKHVTDSPSSEDEQKRKRITSMTVSTSTPSPSPSLNRPASQVLHNKLSEALAQRGGVGGPGGGRGRGAGIGRGGGRPT